jgi:drug/metabolite transporter (DMT)-like permease
MPHYIQPSPFILVRALGAFFLFSIVSLKFEWEKIEIKDIPKLALCGLFGVAMNQLLFFNGLNLTTPVNASIIMVSSPILVLLVSAAMARERITSIKIIGILIGAFGALFLVFAKQNTPVFAPNTGLGNLMVLINSLAYGIYLVLVKPLMQKYRPITVIRWVFGLGFIMVLPFGWRGIGNVQWIDFPTIIWLEVAFVVLCTTFITYLFNIYALKHLNPSAVSAYIYLQPILAALFAILMGKDVINFNMIISAVLVFFGVYLVIRK